MTTLASLLIDSKEMCSGTHFSHALGVGGDYRLIFTSASCLLTLQKPQEICGLLPPFYHFGHLIYSFLLEAQEEKSWCDIAPVIREQVLC